MRYPFALVAALTVAFCTPAVGQATDALVLLASRWAAGVDRGATTIAATPAGRGLVVTVKAAGGPESYPKISRAWDAAQDWSRFQYLRLRVRLTCDAPGVTERQLAIVLYDEKTRRTDLPDRPMTQQCISHLVPVGRWVDLQSRLVDIHRTSIRAVAVYLYENPPDTPHTCRWELAEFAIVGPNRASDVLDGCVYAPGSLGKGVAAAGPPRARVAGDGLALSFDAGGGIRSVAQGGRTLGTGGGRPTGFLVRDAAAGGAPVQVPGPVAASRGGMTERARLKDLALEVSASVRSVGQAIEAVATVADTRGTDRAITVMFAVPVKSAPWHWWDSVAASRVPREPTEEMNYLEGGLEYGINGTHSKYPLGTISCASVGALTLAVRMDEPIVHRITYDARLGLFLIAADIGLVHMQGHTGRDLSRTTVRFLLYGADPALGMRSALQKYYDLFPQFFTKRTRSEGGWYCWGDASKTEGAVLAGFGVHWGPSGYDAVKWDAANGILSFLYIEPELYQQTMGDLNRTPTRSETMARLAKLAAGDDAEIAAFAKLTYASSYVPGPWTQAHSLKAAVQAVTQAAERSAIYGADGAPIIGMGKYPWMGESQWGAVFACNLDPDIPGGKGPFASDIYLMPEFKAADGQGAHYDGVGLDSFGGYNMCSRADYRRANFVYADEPLSFGAGDYKPVRVAAFASVKWLRRLAERLHAEGRYLMTNCSWGMTPGWLTFAAPYLDVFGAEAPSFADPDFIRAIACGKTCTDLPYDPRPDWEVPKHLLHGIFPGHGNKLDAMRQVAPLLQALAKAGWQPITNATVTPAGARLERFGQGSEVYFVLHNPTDKPVTAALRLDARALGLDGRPYQLIWAEPGLSATDMEKGIPLAPLETKWLKLVRQE